MGSLFGYIGTYTEGAGGKAKGIYVFIMDSETGVIEDLRLAVDLVNPSYIALSPSKKFLYAVNDIGQSEGKPSGVLSAFAIEKDGGLRFLNYKSSGGAGPCHVVIHKDGGHAVVANYSGGVIGVLPIDRKTGLLGDPIQTIQYEGSGPNTNRQEKAHAHSFTFDPEGKNGFACDLGSDRVMPYRFDKKAARPLIPWVVPVVPAKPGAGPRHGVFHPNGIYAYVLNELGSTVDVLKHTTGNAGDSFEKLQNISTLPRGFKENSIAAAVRITADGKLLYASNRGHNSIAVFKVLKTGLLEFIGTLPCGGKSPRDTILVPEENFFLAINRESDNIAVLRINHKTGLLKKEREYCVPSPVSVIFR